MPRVLKAGDTIKDYRITNHLNTGAMANAFAAETSAGRKVFFKQYKSPTVAVSWFDEYVEYQRELNKRVREPNLRRFCVHQLDSFVYKFGVETFFQVYEFIEGGHDLEGILERIRKTPLSLSWNQRCILAKVMMAGIHQLHEQNIAHGDLKPPNLQMMEDKSIEAGFQLKLIDMDFSVLSDRKAPWHGHAPYVGSPRYFSPEHLKGETPSRESDIFTCGIILYELLAQGHPYPSADDGEYFRKVKAHSAIPPALIGSLSDEGATHNLAQMIHRCLSPCLTDRPSAREVNYALNGKASALPVPLKPPATPKTVTTSHKVSPRGDESPLNPLVLTGAKTNLSFNISTPVGKQLLRPFGEDARFVEDHQFTLDRRGTEWWLTPQSGTRNYTFLNGRPALVPTVLKKGDRIEIGSRTTEGKTILPLIVG